MIREEGYIDLRQQVELKVEALYILVPIPDEAKEIGKTGAKTDKPKRNSDYVRCRKLLSVR